MHSFLRQSTASQSRAMGPFTDDTDFKSAETGLTIANTDIQLVMNGAASANKNSGGGTHRANGIYGLTFDATDTATVGELFVAITVSGALPVFATFVVVEEAVYDLLFASGATGATALGPGAITSATFAAGAITAAAIATDAIDADAISADAVTEIQAGLATATEVAKIPKSDGSSTWNATALAALQQEATDALNAYDPPTKAEMDAALAAADDAVLAAIAALNNLSAAQVNAEVVDALNVDTYAEPTGVPAATASLVSKIGRLHEVLRNKLTVTASSKTLYDDAGAALWSKALSDTGTEYLGGRRRVSIDSAEKRRSVSGVWTGFFPVAVTVNSAKDQEWRQQAGWGYSGILSSVVTYESVTMGDLFVLETLEGDFAVLETLAADLAVKVN